MLVLACLCALPCAAQEARLVAHFPLDEGTGTHVRDVGPSALSAEVHGATWSRLGRGWALYFDGEDDYVRCGAAPALDLRGPLTLSAWVWPEETPQGEVGIAGKQFSSFLLTYYHDRKVWWYIGSGTNHATAALSPGNWSHVTGTFDGQSLGLYVNGELVDKKASTFPDTPAGGDFTIGCVVGDTTAADPAYANSGYFQGHIAGVRLYAGAVSAGEVAAQFRAEVGPRLEAIAEGCPPIRSAESIAADGLRVRVGRSGALQVSLGGAYCLVESGLSYPGTRLGWNRLTEREPRAEAGWQPEISRSGEDAIRVGARGAGYELVREVAIRRGRVEVADRITNVSRELVGVLVEHRLIAPSLLAHARLGLGAADPFVFAGQPQYDAGLLAEDDISRAQFTPFASANRMGFRLDHFGLAPGASHTLRWAVYLLPPSGDCFALVNRIREDWGSNHTVLGPGSFVDANDPVIGDSERLKAYLTRRRLRIAMLSPWLDYDPGSMDRVLTRDEYRDMMQRAAKALKAADPEVQCLGSIETDWVTIDPARLPGGDRLPVDGPGGHGPTWITPEATGVIEASGLPWLDSLKRDETRRAMLELYSRGGKPQTALGVYPVVGNYQARFLHEQARFLCEDVGLDGFYIDEFCPYWVRSHDRWDGFTVDIDRRTGRILRSYSDAGLAGAAFREGLCRYAVSRGAAMVANTFATTCAENALPVMRFAETWSGFDVAALPAEGRPPFNAYVASGQLGTPLGLGILQPPQSLPRAEWLMRGLILYLRHGVLYYHYFFGDLPESGEGSGEYGPINHMFPITPVRLFEGGIEGRERTLTCVPGQYLRRGPKPPTVRVFGPDGREVPGAYELRKAARAWTVDLRLRDWTEIAVIE